VRTKLRRDLPGYGAIVLAARSAGLDDPILDRSPYLDGAPHHHTLVHLCFVQTTRCRAAVPCFFAQVICML